MRNEIKLSVIYTDIHLFEIDFFISNEDNLTTGNFYQDAESHDLKDFASKLISFPLDIEDKVIFEIGVEEHNNNRIGYLLFEIQCYQETGQALIHVKTSSNQPLPFTSLVEFYIRTDPASINRLGEMINNLTPEVGQEITWSVD